MYLNWSFYKQTFDFILEKHIYLYTLNPLVEFLKYSSHKILQ